MTHLAQLTDGHNTLLKVEQMIDNHELEQAEELISGLRRVPLSDRRYKEHLKSKIHFVRGEYDRCIHLINKTIDNHGNNVGLIIDKAYAFYLKKDFYNFEETVAELEREYSTCREELDIDILVKTTIALGRFLEDLGHVQKVIKLYNKLLLDCEYYTDQAPIVLSQIIRLKSLWKIEEGLLENYEKLISKSPLNCSESVQFDIEHALFLAELQLFDNNVATKRLNTIFDDLKDEQKHILVHDFLESSLRDDVSVSRKIRDFISKSDKTSFEEGLIKIGKGESILFSRLTKELPLGQILRLMSLSIKKKISSDALKGQFNFLLETFSSKDKAHWNRLIKSSEKETSEKKLEIDLSNSKLAFAGRIYDFKRKQNAKIILTLLVGRRSVSLDEVTKEIWNDSFNNSYYNRIRMAVGRINSDVNNDLLVGGFINLLEDRVEINKNILIK